MNTLSGVGLNSLLPSRQARVIGLTDGCDLSRRLADVGFVPGAPVECVLARRGIAAYRIRGAVIALRDRDAAHIRIRPCL